MGGDEFVAGPIGGEAGHGVEADGGCQARADAVVIATNIQLGERANDIKYLIGTGTVAHHVAEIPDGVEGTRSGIQNRSEGFEIRVDVGDD